MLNYGTQNKSLSDLDYQFLAASVEWDRQEIQLKLEAERTKEIEARLAQEEKTAKLQRYLLGVVSIALVFYFWVRDDSFLAISKSPKQ